VAAISAFGIACYAITFLVFAIGRSERDAYVTKAVELARLRRRVAAAA